jgi:hypothetical protein
MRYPKYSSSSQQKWLFDALTFSSALGNLVNTSSKRTKWFSKLSFETDHQEIIKVGSGKFQTIN